MSKKLTTRKCGWQSLIICLATLLLPLSSLADEGFGQRILGAVGLDAGSQSDPGVYVGDRFIQFSADRYIGADGKQVPIKGLDVSSFANVFAIAGTYKFETGPYYTAAFAAPVAGVSVHSEWPPKSFENSGLGDLFIQPIKLGWRLPQLDLTTSYSLYAPTNQLNRKGLAHSQWMHQISAGGTVFFDEAKTFRLSALSSYNIYDRKPNIDVTRGDTVQIQGGLGSRLFKVLDIGLAGYAFWQVAADTGKQLPPALHGVSEYAMGLGPEIGLLIPQIRGKLTARYEWELQSRSRLDGQVLVVSLSLLGWQPED